MLASSASAVIVQFLPNADNSSQASGLSQPEGQTNASSPSISVFVPDHAAYLSLESVFQQDSGVRIDSFGYLANIVFSPGERSFVTEQLDRLIAWEPGLYIVNHTNSVYTPFSVYTPAATGTQYYTPNNIYSAYSYTGANNMGLLGNGTTIAIVDAYGDPFIGYDVVAFDNQTGLPPVQLTIKYLNNTPNPYNKSWAIETALDVEWAHASAPGARILLIITQNASSSLEDGLSYAISKDVANVLSLSWGSAESDLSSSDLMAQDQLYRIAAEENITVFAASGDLGSNDGKTVPTVSFPASDPYVVGVGGTALSYNNGKYTETAWGGNQSSGSTFGSGGGYSGFFLQPYWQRIGNKSTGMRGVPDVSAIADTYTAVIMIADGKAYTVGGTSLATPLWAGITSRIDQSIGRNVGFLDPTLYQIYNSSYYPEAFRSITSGSNGLYSASYGWDPVTGLGTPQVTSLIQAVDNLTSPYGSVVIQNGSYGFSSASANLSISGLANQLRLNGSVYYYLSYYYDNQSYARFGVSISNRSVESRLSIRDGNLSTVVENYLGVPTANMHFSLGIAYNGSSLEYSLNGSKVFRNVLMPFAGESRFAIGAEFLRPSDNYTSIPIGSFSSVKVYSANGTTLAGNLWQNHYSGTGGEFQYSSIGFASLKSALEVRSGENLSDGFLNQSFPDNSTIKYSMYYSDTVTVNLSLSQPISGLTWIIDGSPGSPSGIMSPGVHNITAQSLGVNISSTRIYVPHLFRTNITVVNPVSYYNPQMDFILDDLIAGSGTLGNFTAYLPSGTNSLSIRADGYLPSNSTIQAGKDFTAKMTAVYSTISVFVFQGNSTVTVNGQTITGSRGTYQGSITPERAQINISSPGFKSVNLSAFNPLPARNYSFSVLLTPTNLSLLSLSGTLRDAIYGFNLSGVLVKLGNYTYGFTNTSGFYQLYAPPDIYSLQFSAPYYNTSAIVLNLTSSTVKNVSLFPESLNLSNTFEPTVGFYLPIGYFCIYVSWSSKSVEGIASYIVEFSTNSNMSGARSIQVSGSSQYTVIFPVGLAADYYVQVIAKLVSGQVVPGEIHDLKGTSLPVLLVNAGIYTAIGLYIFLSVRILRRAFGKKKRYS